MAIYDPKRIIEIATEDNGNRIVWRVFVMNKSLAELHGLIHGGGLAGYDENQFKELKAELMSARARAKTVTSPMRILFGTVAIIAVIASVALGLATLLGHRHWIWIFPAALLLITLSVAGMFSYGGLDDYCKDVQEVISSLDAEKARVAAENAKAADDLEQAKAKISADIAKADAQSAKFIREYGRAIIMTADGPANLLQYIKDNQQNEAHADADDSKLPSRTRMDAGTAESEEDSESPRAGALRDRTGRGRRGRE
jgi:uncharacterized protein YgfB (UPF0149 family)